MKERDIFRRFLKSPRNPKKICVIVFEIPACRRQVCNQETGNFSNFSLDKPKKSGYAESIYHRGV